MSAPEVSVVSTGTANQASVLAALHRLGARTRVVEHAAELDAAERVVLPGVGSFGAAMDRLRARELDAVLSARLRAGRATLAICLGMQLFATQSEEDPGVAGLALFPGEVRRFPATVHVPQLGWNMVELDERCVYLQSGWAYFANSYRLDSVPAGWRVALADHGGRFVAACERGGVLACQFHPELSGSFGAAILERWLEHAPEEAGR